MLKSQLTISFGDVRISLFRTFKGEPVEKCPECPHNLDEHNKQGCGLCGCSVCGVVTIHKLPSDAIVLEDAGGPPIAFSDHAPSKPASRNGRPS